jgi:hypothetical protein
VLALVSAAVGLLAADRAIRFVLDLVSARFDAAPFWSIRGLGLTTVLYASGIAVVSAVMLSLLPALRVTRTRLQPHLANLGAGHATLRFGRVWTGAMIIQVALAAIGLPAALAAAGAVAENGAHPQRIPKHGLRERENRPASTHQGADRCRHRPASPGPSLFPQQNVLDLR